MPITGKVRATMNSGLNDWKISGAMGFDGLVAGYEVIGQGAEAR